MRLLLSSIGMINSVGHDVRTSCASIRAGIMRASFIHHFVATEAETHESVPIAGCMVTPQTDGFGSVGRWTILGLQALNDMLQYGKLDLNDAKFWQKTALVFALPSLDEANFDFEGVVDADNAKSVFVAPFMAQSPVPIPLNFCQIVHEDDTAVISALEKVETALSHEQIERVIVLAVDSLVDGHRLQWLNMMQRVKTPEMPVGLMPGEGAVALMFEKEESIAARNVKPLARVYGHSMAVEPNNLLSEDGNTGEGLSKSIRKTLSAVQLDGPYAGVIYSDLNGEEWRAQEYSLARFNLSHKELDNHNIWENFPAAAIGDVGVATPATSICMLIEAQQRNYAKSPDALILASSASGSAASMLVRAY